MTTITVQSLIEKRGWDYHQNINDGTFTIYTEFGMTHPFASLEAAYVACLGELDSTPDQTFLLHYVAQLQNHLDGKNFDVPAGDTVEYLRESYKLFGEPVTTTDLGKYDLPRRIEDILKTVGPENALIRDALMIYHWWHILLSDRSRRISVRCNELSKEVSYLKASYHESFQESRAYYITLVDALKSAEAALLKTTEFLQGNPTQTNGLSHLLSEYIQPALKDIQDKAF